MQQSGRCYQLCFMGVRLRWEKELKRRKGNRVKEGRLERSDYSFQELGRPIFSLSLYFLF